MTPAERQFADAEGGLMRARCLVRVLREILDCGSDHFDRVLQDGAYVIACEAETAVNDAADLWTEAHRKIGRPA